MFFPSRVEHSPPQICTCFSLSFNLNVFFSLNMIWELNTSKKLRIKFEFEILNDILLCQSQEDFLCFILYFFFFFFFFFLGGGGGSSI